MYRSSPLYKKDKKKRKERPEPILLSPPKPVICLTDGNFFLSITDAAKFYQCSHSLISLQLSGKYKTAKGKKFMFLYDSDIKEMRWTDNSRQRFSEQRKKYHALRKFRKEVLDRLEEKGELGPRLGQRLK